MSEINRKNFRVDFSEADPKLNDSTDMADAIAKVIHDKNCDYVLSALLSMAGSILSTRACCLPHAAESIEEAANRMLDIAKVIHAEPHGTVN